MSLIGLDGVRKVSDSAFSYEEHKIAANHNPRYLRSAVVHDRIGPACPAADQVHDLTPASSRGHQSEGFLFRYRLRDGALGV